MRGAASGERQGCRRLATAARAATVASCAVLLSGCASADPVPAASGTAPSAEATSLLGEPLVPGPIPPEARARMEAQLAEARAAYDARPDDPDALIWLGRRLAYLGRYRDAIAVFTEGAEKHPDDPRMLRHRGHRHITVRELDDAIRDLSRAREMMLGRPDEIEPDGMPNAAGIPRSTLKFNILYHLALAHYLEHDFERALPVWRETLEVSTNDDLLVAASDWLYMTLRRLGRDAEAARVLEPVRPEMDILENDAYHRRLLMYRGELEPEALLDVDTADPVQLATYGYGVGNWYLYNGDEARAFEVFRRILEGTGWAAFGYIAAEAEVARRAR